MRRDWECGRFSLLLQDLSAMLLCLQYTHPDLWCEGIESRSRGRLGGFYGDVRYETAVLRVYLDLPPELVFMSGQEV